MRLINISFSAAVLTSGVFLTACGSPMGFGQLTGNSTSTAVNQANLPACAVDAPQLALNGNLNSFQLSSSTGFGVGYSPGGGSAIGNVSVNFSVAKVTMDISLAATDPFSTQELGYGDGSSNQTNSTVGGGVTIQGIALALSNYSQTPLATVSQNALSSALSQVLSTLASHQMGWKASIQSFVADGRVKINAGGYSNVKAGDQFDVYNVNHTDPCQRDDVVTFSPQTPVATITISSSPDAISSSYSLANVKLNGSTPIYPGAQVVPVSSNKKTYLMGVSIGTVTAQPLVITDSTGTYTIDIQSALTAQLKALAMNNFYVR